MRVLERHVKEDFNDAITFCLKTNEFLCVNATIIPIHIPADEMKLSQLFSCDFESVTLLEVFAKMS